MTGPQIALPPHRYVPGRTARHPDGHFDAIRSSVQPGMDADALARTAAWRAGLAYLHAQYFWEAHEVMEPVWMACPPNSVERGFVQAAIQLANAALKRRMERPNAARRLFAEAERLERECATAGRAEVLGLPLTWLALTRRTLSTESVSRDEEPE